ncbi:hypothetical protein SAMD00079811_78190 (plasmid) [Scytonema sp. HK-05]|uniref:hypothetical protein n=1 Tax=Scytonema sp. HK-05 TaxID=1137095 RepID=UPI00095EE9A2|nr:hypothetical protein [Scytonema sp. HK-05]OKH56548.1 hypothetical protein NIES2130_24665 [Scytonema sp. HK-05]BAY50190.1 hypothetical protein SAMD00079811_78190 [Scytonema sp. HK-05]
MELFDTSKYSTAISYDFEFEQLSCKKKVGRFPLYDPAWDDGSAFRDISSQYRISQVRNELISERLCVTLRVPPRSSAFQNATN